MAITIKNRYLIIGILAFVGLTFAFGWSCGRQRGDNATTPLIDTLNAIVDRQVTTIGKKTLYIAKVNQEVLTLKDALNKGLVDNQTLKALQLKNVSEITRLKGMVKILADSISIGGMGVIIINDCDTSTVDTTKAVKIPFAFEKIDKFYQIHGLMDDNANMSFDLTVPMQIDVITGWDRKAKQYKSAVLTDNPYVQLNGVRSTRIGTVKAKPWGIGVNVGYGVGFQKNPILIPYCGIGLNYSIIRW